MAVDRPVAVDIGDESGIQGRILCEDVEAGRKVFRITNGRYQKRCLLLQY